MSLLNKKPSNILFILVLTLTVWCWIGFFPKYHGKIDEFRVYDRALSQGEILTLAEKTSATQPVVSIADINGDGTVNLADFASVAQNWLDLSFWPAY